MSCSSTQASLVHQQPTALRLVREDFKSRLHDCNTYLTIATTHDGDRWKCGCFIPVLTDRVDSGQLIKIAGRLQRAGTPN